MALQALGISSHTYFMSVNIDNIILFDNITLQIKQLNVGVLFFV